MTTPDIIFADTETTSLRRPFMTAARQVWDVGFIVWPGGDRTARREVQFYVPVTTEDADSFALKIGKYWERYPHRDEPSRYIYEPTHGTLLDRDLVAKRLSRTFHDAVMVGNNPRFDDESMAALCYDEGHIFEPYYHLVDLYALSLGWLMARGKFDPTRMPLAGRDVSLLVGVEPPSDEEAHSALVDARWNERWYLTLLESGADTEA